MPKQLTENQIEVFLSEFFKTCMSNVGDGNLIDLEEVLEAMDVSDEYVASIQYDMI